METYDSDPLDTVPSPSLTMVGSQGPTDPRTGINPLNPWSVFPSSKPHTFGPGISTDSDLLLMYGGSNDSGRPGSRDLNRRTGVR